jgi:hypothetical protein
VYEELAHLYRATGNAALADEYAVNLQASKESQ